MVALGVSAINVVSWVTVFEVSMFMHCKVTKIQSFSDLSKGIFANYFLAVKAHFM